MQFILNLFGEGKDLTAFQMSARGIIVFFAAFLLIRLSGRRSFGLRTPLDNIITILLGAVLSRAVVGASPFIAVIITCFVLVLLHRAIGWLITTYPKIGRSMEGEKIKLYENGQFLTRNMKKALVCKEDIMEGVRKSALTDSMDDIEMVYMEKNGDISPIKKKL